MGGSSEALDWLEISVMAICLRSLSDRKEKRQSYRKYMMP
ncbi:hypothetical protein APS_0553 [Acetobacter pasteurianus subsp. pasteurianus LMG 1262 = NBRC 106471]|nr:hypothetical protein APS_0553 [Acetobacter pasteurianus subsp. pasteurianus LMG 1262 = NBRC 106471]